MMKVFVEAKGTTLGVSRSFPVDILVFIDSEAYEKVPYNEKYKIRAALAAINWGLPRKGKHAVLVAPGKLGTPYLTSGVPAAFPEICRFDAVFEFSDERRGYLPEFSSRSRFFQTLMESDILYTALPETDNTVCFIPEFLKHGENEISRYLKADGVTENVIHVRNVENRNVVLCYNMEAGHLLVADDHIA